MNLFIKKILIEKSGKITESFSFGKGLSVIKGSAELYNVLRALLGKKEATKSLYDLRFWAEVEIDKTYYVCGHKKKEEASFSLSAYCDEADCASAYFEAVRQHAEMESTLFFDHLKKQNFPRRLLKYKDILTYYPGGDFASLTNGYGTTRSFRAFIASYIKYFKPIKLRADKDFYLTLSKEGAFKVARLGENESPLLSESEKVLYHYLSFISLADFWDRAEAIRNLNCIKKPLVICDFLERLDDSINIFDILRRTDRLRRQTIIFADKKSKPTEFDIRNGAKNE